MHTFYQKMREPSWQGEKQRICNLFVVYSCLYEARRWNRWPLQELQRPLDMRALFLTCSSKLATNTGKYSG